MRVSTVNKNGMNHIEVPILVEPINDPPLIYVPEFIIFEEKKSEEVLIFDRERDKFNFSVWDPDLIFPGMCKYLSGELGYAEIFNLSCYKNMQFSYQPN